MNDDQTARIVEQLREIGGQRGVAVAGPAIVPRELLFQAADLLTTLQDALKKEYNCPYCGQRAPIGLEAKDKE